VNEGTRKKRRGVALISTLLVMLIIMVLAAGFVFFTANDLVVSRNMVDTAVTLNLAESGIDYAIYLLKHNMTIYPGTYAGVAGDVSNFPSGYAVYNAAYYGSNSTLCGNGSIINLYVTTLPSGSSALEHVVISSLSYGGSNFLTEGNFCGTFELHIVSQSDVGSTRSILFESIGRIRSIPTRFTGTPDWTTMKDGTWTEKARRTLFSKVSIQTSAGGTQGNNLIIRTFYERFR